MATRKTGGRAAGSTKSPAARGRTRRSGWRPGRGGSAASQKTWTRLTKSFDTAEDALKELRKELGRGGKEVFKDLEKALKDSRKTAGSAQKAAAKQAEVLQRVVTTGRKTKPAAKRASSGGSRSTAKRSTAKRSSSSR